MRTRDKKALTKKIIENQVRRYNFPRNLNKVAEDIDALRINENNWTPFSSDYELLGLRGEWIASQILEFPFNDSVGEYDGGIDGYWRNHSVQVKTSSHISANYKYPTYMIFFLDEVASLSADIYLLIIVQGLIGYIGGWADPNLILKKGVKMKLGKGYPDRNGDTKRWCVDMADLNTSLVDILK